MRKIEEDILAESVKALSNLLENNTMPAFIEIYKGQAEVSYWPIRPMALCNLTGEVHAASWWENLGVYIERADAAVAFVYAASRIYAVFESGLSFSFHPLHIKSVGYALGLIEAPCRLKYEFNDFVEQTRRRKALNLIADIRVFDILPPVERLFLPWGAVILRK